MLCTLPLFFAAGMIEGVIRQTTLSDEGRYAIALGSFLLWGLFFVLAGRDAEEEDVAGPRLRIRQL